ncbi:MAG: hypothetical protein KDB00_01980 [Planctomycetales bacterium]|nr:hypothetical protein [Planctomycetales bacterium]
MSPHLSDPLSQFLQVGHVHPDDKLLSMDVVNGQDVVHVEDYLIALIQLVQSSFHESIIHDATEETA